MPAWADDDITPPKVMLLSPGSINLSDGGFDYNTTDLSIGTLQLQRFHLPRVTAPGRLDADSPFFGTHMDNNFDIYVVATQKAKTQWTPQHTAPTVHIGATAMGEWYFTGTGNGNLAAQSGDAEQANLALSSGVYIYTDHDGTVYTFNSGVAAAGVLHGNLTKRIGSIQFANGLIRTFSYNGSGQLKEVADSSGYAIIFDYADTSQRVAVACGFNTSQTFVTPSSTCTGATLKVTYGYTGALLTSITDVVGKVTTLQYSLNNITCVLPPGYTTCKFDNSGYYSNPYTSTQVLGDGAVWTYSISAYEPLRDCRRPILLSHAAMAAPFNVS